MEFFKIYLESSINYNIYPKNLHNTPPTTHMHQKKMYNLQFTKI